ncbi:hypothetical protein OEZ85_012275 [Tetradesmus obliquus]|uniref:Uncharacterized protein n=1 Tax=Tetradesmus obliquus TaxID=3088 RepID=A0ABY8TSV8_TETOB|nr:hypothetical protein OEZ85_012275 [Tetradesmus obliquus]
MRGYSPDADCRPAAPGREEPFAAPQLCSRPAPTSPPPPTFPRATGGAAPRRPPRAPGPPDQRKAELEAVMKAELEAKMMALEAEMIKRFEARAKADATASIEAANRAAAPPACHKVTVACSRPALRRHPHCKLV